MADRSVTPPEWYCPDHGVPLQVEPDALVCPDGHEFPVADGIPRFVPSEVYAAAFGAQWKHFSRTRLDSYTGTSITGDRTRRCLGEELWENLSGLNVLECGCGAGRFTEVLLERGANVTSIDLSEAVDANRESFPLGPKHRIAQADITRLPFARRRFDVVFCLGVIQHTPDPERTISCLYDHVAPGGWLVIDHYRFRVRWYLRTAPYVRWVLKRLSPDAGMRATERIVDAFLPLHRRFHSTPVLSTLLNRVSPVLQYYREYPDLDDRLQREWALLDTHDALTDWFKHYRSKRALERVLRDLGLADIWAAEGGNGVEARGRCPLR